MKSAKTFLISCCALALAFTAESSVASTYDLTFTGNFGGIIDVGNINVFLFVTQGETVPNAVFKPGDTLNVDFDLPQPFTLPAGVNLSGGVPTKLDVELPANFPGTNANNQIDYSETISFSNGGVAVPNSVFTPFSSSSTTSSSLELGGLSSLQKTPALSFDRLDLAVTLLDGEVGTVPGDTPQFTLSTTTPSVVPIPASLYLLVGGLTGLVTMGFVGGNRNKRMHAPVFGFDGSISATPAV